jgi:hypothetical protein
MDLELQEYREQPIRAHPCPSYRPAVADGRFACLL